MPRLRPESANSPVYPCWAEAVGCPFGARRRHHCILHGQVVWGDAVGEVDFADVLEEVLYRVVTVAGQSADDLVYLVGVARGFS